jgi:hypothetical protein
LKFLFYCFLHRCHSLRILAHDIFSDHTLDKLADQEQLLGSFHPTWLGRHKVAHTNLANIVLREKPAYQLRERSGLWDFPKAGVLGGDIGDPFRVTVDRFGQAHVDYSMFLRSDEQASEPQCWV